jgi:hypothetical protein
MAPSRTLPDLKTLAFDGIIYLFPDFRILLRYVYVTWIYWF